MASISSLSKSQQKLVGRIWNGRSVKPRKIVKMFNSVAEDFYNENPDLITGNKWKKPTNLINGQKPAGELLPLQNSSVVIDEVVGTDKLHVSIGKRAAGTRVGIHVHELAGLTFVMKGKGEITDFVEGMENKLHPKGNYYFMPANIQMSASNQSSQDVWLMDIFVTNDAHPNTITIIEPQYPGYTNPIN